MLWDSSWPKITKCWTVSKGVGNEIQDFLIFFLYKWGHRSICFLWTCYIRRGRLQLPLCRRPCIRSRDMCSKSRILQPSRCFPSCPASPLTKQAPGCSSHALKISGAGLQDREESYSSLPGSLVKLGKIPFHIRPRQNMLALISPHQLLFRYVFKDNKQTSQVGRYGRRVQNQHLINTSFDESGRNDSLPVCDTMALFTTHPLSEKLQQLWI